jgi:hypothetical protein
MRFYKGAITYQDIINMPISEILEWQERAKQITDEYNKEMARLEKQRH